MPYALGIRHKPYALGICLRHMPTAKRSTVHDDTMHITLGYISPLIYYSILIYHVYIRCCDVTYVCVCRTVDACVGLNWLLVSFLSHVNKNIIHSFIHIFFFFYPFRPLILCVSMFFLFLLSFFYLLHIMYMYFYGPCCLI